MSGIDAAGADAFVVVDQFTASVRQQEGRRLPKLALGAQLKSVIAGTRGRGTKVRDRQELRERTQRLAAGDLPARQSARLNHAEERIRDQLLKGRPQRQLFRGELVHFPAAVHQPAAFVADVSRLDDDASGKLALEMEVPLLHVRGMY